MKLPNPPENITLRLSGEAIDRLKAIHAGTKWKLEELAAKLFEGFLAEDEVEGMTGGPKQPRKRGGVPLETTGAADDN